jgi:hypothetical protein
MAFRTQARIGAILAFATILTYGQDVEVRHRHLRRDGIGKLSVTQDGLAFSESGKGHKHSRTWTYEDIQQLELSSETLRILTYEDQKLKFGRDREYFFDRLPEGFAQTVYGQWRERLDQRFIAVLPDKGVQPVFEIPAKLLGIFQGSEGVVRFAADRIVYQTEKPGESRTWRFVDIENVATAGPFDLSVNTGEHHGATNTASREFRFQLKKPIPEVRYNELWRRLNDSKQLDFIQSSLAPTGAK